MKVLQLNSSVRGPDSVSSKYATLIANKFLASGHEVVTRDLATHRVSTLDNEALTALFTGQTNNAVVNEYNVLINELLEQDILIIGVPMYNFSIPTQLKNYFDAVSRSGVTFTYSQTGPVGLTKVKKAYVVLSRGGKYKDAGYVFQEQYIETYLKFLGVKEVQFLHVEGLNMGEVVATQSNQEITESINKLIV